MPSPLRPELYKRLKGRLGPVTIASEGEAFQGSVTWDPVKNRYQLQAIWPGEYYVTNCPFCSDTRQRLWINHRWGLYVKALKSDNLWLAICYNENCLSVSGRALQLKDLIFNDFLNGRQPDPVLPGRVMSSEEIHKARLPAANYWVPTLDRLPAGHPACAYLRERGYDPVWLGAKLQVAYCCRADPCFRPAQDRIIIPVHHKGDLVGWQGRFVGEPPSKKIPKYYTMPCMARKQLLYNLDLARQYSYVVVCEGVTDVWRFGPEAVALFGKQASPPQRALLRSRWRDGVVVILLDADAQTEAHRIADSAELRDLNKVVVKLPEGKDPGRFRTLGLRDFIFRAVRKQGVHVGIRDVKLDRETWMPTVPPRAAL